MALFFTNIELKQSDALLSLHPIDYELLAENQSEVVNNDNALYPSDQISTPKLKSEENNEDNNFIPNLGGFPSAEPEPTKEVSTGDILEPTEIGDPNSGSIKPKKNKPKVPPTSIQTRSVMFKETIESDSDSDTDIKKSEFWHKFIMTCFKVLNFLDLLPPNPIAAFKNCCTNDLSARIMKSPASMSLQIFAIMEIHRNIPLWAKTFSVSPTQIMLTQAFTNPTLYTLCLLRFTQ